MKVESNSSISPSQAHYVLGKLLSEKRVTSREVSDYLSQMDGEIRDLEARLAVLREARVAGAVSPVLPARARRGRPASTPRVEPAKPAPRKRSRRRSRKAASAPATAERSESQQLQGKYLSLIRQIAKERRSRFQQIALQQGREEAIKQMRTELKK